MKVRVTIATLDAQGGGTGLPVDAEVEAQSIRVLGGFPGDVVEARLTSKPRKQGAWYADFLRVEQPSADRAPHNPCQIWRPECACPLMPLSEQAQADHKRGLVVSAFANVSGVSIANTAADIAPAISYRSKIVLVARKTREGTIFGGYARGSHYVLDLDGCVIEELPLRHAAAWTRENLAQVVAFDESDQSGELRYVAMRSTSDGGVLVTWIGAAKEPSWAHHLAHRLMHDVPGIRGVLWAENVAAKNAIWDKAPRVIAGAEHVEEKVHGLRFAISSRSFFQVHRAQAIAMREAMLREIQGLLGDNTGGLNVWDLYCGVGVNALFLAQQGAKVLGMESVLDAVADAQKNAAANNMSVQFSLVDLDNVGDAFAALLAPDVVVLNPPRKGAPQTLVASIAAAKPKCIVYIACAPGPLAAAAAWLKPLGYVTRSVVPFDLFPHTEHVETLAVFVPA